jgi:hypothetical protein
MPFELATNGAPAATAPAVAGTAVAESDVWIPVVEIETPVAARPRTILPVPVAFKLMVPEPLASIVRLSFVPDDTTAIAIPPAAAAPVREIPVATDDVLALTLSTGFVAPFAPTVSAEAEVEVTVVAPVMEQVSVTAFPMVVFPVTERSVRDTPAIDVDPVTVRSPAICIGRAVYRPPLYLIAGINCSIGLSVPTAI